MRKRTLFVSLVVLSFVSFRVVVVLFAIRVFFPDLRVRTFRSPFDIVESRDTGTNAYILLSIKRPATTQNGIRERLRIGTRPKLRQRRDWETDIESARAAGRDADVYIIRAR